MGLQAGGMLLLTSKTPVVIMHSAYRKRLTPGFGAIAAASPRTDASPKMEVLTTEGGITKDGPIARSHNTIPPDTRSGARPINQVRGR